MTTVHVSNLDFSSPPKKKTGRPRKVYKVARDEEPAEVQPPPDDDREQHHPLPSRPVDVRMSWTPPPTPPLRTEALIADAVVKAIRSIDIAPRLRIKRVDVVPEYSIADDSQLIAANVMVKFSMVFTRDSND